MFPSQNPNHQGAMATATTAQQSGGALTGPGRSDSMEHPLRPLVAAWVEKMRLAADHKRAKFQDDADEAMAFFNGPYDFMYEKKYASGSRGFQTGPNPEDEDMPAPSFKMTVNKVAEGVQIFGPVLYHRNPIRQVNPRQLPQLPPELFGAPDDPAAAMAYQQVAIQSQQMQTIDRLRSVLIQFYLNYTPVELDLKTHSRRAIDESIIKGMGCLWTELYQPKGANFKLVGSFYDSVDHLLIDPDTEEWENAQWIARKCTHPVWQVEREYNLEPGSLKGSVESATRQSEVNTDPDGDYDRKRGTTNDLVSYWKIWSKMGVGGRLSGCPDELKQTLEQFGDFCYLVITEDCPYPLNLPPSLQQAADPGSAEQVLQALDWPTPFWVDDAWPVTPLAFHEVPRCPWPMSHFKPAMGELKFLNWAYSYLAGKIRATCRDFVAIAKSASEDLKDAILHGRDLTLIEIERAHGTISEVVQFLQHPQMNGDVWKVIEAVTTNFEKRTGLTELVYGESPSQMRSAEEANLKGSQVQIRPDDMAQKVEDAMTEVARKEALAVRWHLGPQDVQTIMGPALAQAWGRFVNTADVYEMVRQLDYRIEAGSTKKPNRERDAQNMKDAMQALLQPLFTYAQATGITQPFNALISAWGKSIDLDVSGMMLMAPMPPPAPAGGGSGPPAGGEKGPPGQAA